MRKALTLICLTFAFALPTFVLPLLFSPEPAQASVTPTRAERRVLAAINREREAAGLVKLSFKTSLIRAARAHTRDMAAHSFVSHTGSDGSTPSVRVLDFGYAVSGYSSWKVGETLASAPSGTARSRAASIVAAWMDSPGHREVLLTASFRDAGVGIVYGDDGLRYCTVDFGRRVK